MKNVPDAELRLLELELEHLRTQLESTSTIPTEPELPMRRRTAHPTDGMTDGELRDFYLGPEKRESPKPRRIRHVVFDLDDTLVESQFLMEPRPDLDEVEFDCGGSAKGRAKLTPGMREVLGALQRRDIKASVASWASPGWVSCMFDTFELRGRFKGQIEAGWEDKGKMLERIAHDQNVPIEEVLFVDDMFGNVKRAEEVGALGLQMGREVVSGLDLLRYIED